MIVALFFIFYTAVALTGFGMVALTLRHHYLTKKKGQSIE